MTGALAELGGACHDRHPHALAARRRPASPRRRRSRARRPTSRPSVARPRWSTCTGSGRATPGEGRRGPRGGRPLPDRRARHGRALGPAAQALEEAALHGAGRGEEPPPARRACTRCRAPRSATSAASPPGPRSASSPTASISSPSTTCPPRAVLEAEHPELAGKFVLLFFGRLHVKKGLDLLAQALARSRAISPTSTCSWPATTTGPGAVLGADRRARARRRG